MGLIKELRLWLLRKGNEMELETERIGKYDCSGCNRFAGGIIWRLDSAFYESIYLSIISKIGTEPNTLIEANPGEVLIGIVDGLGVKLNKTKPYSCLLIYFRDIAKGEEVFGKVCDWLR